MNNVEKKRCSSNTITINIENQYDVTLIIDVNESLNLLSATIANIIYITVPITVYIKRGIRSNIGAIT
jgi:hypothetical protein